MATTRPRSTIPQPLTEADYPRPMGWAEWGERPDENRMVELWFGEPMMSPTPTPRHQDVVGEMYLALRMATRSLPEARVFVAPLDVRLGDSLVPQPDILVVTGQGRATVRRDAVHGSPDLVVEVLSPGTRKRDLVDKAALYAMAGIPEYWIVDPDAGRLLVNRLVDGAYVRELVDGAGVACAALGDAAVDISWLAGFRDSAAGVQEEPATYDTGAVGEDA